MPTTLLAEMILQGDVFQQKGKLWHAVDSTGRILNISLLAKWLFCLG